MATVSHAELQVELPKLFECVRHPIVSMGVLRWVEYTLTDPTFFEVAAESTSLFLVLLDEVCLGYCKMEKNKIMVGREPFRLSPRRPTVPTPGCA